MRISDWSSDVCSADLACTDLATPASARRGGSDAPQFTRISEAYALLPQAFGSRYQGIDHRFVLTLFDGPGCSGTSLTLTSQENGRPGAYRLSAYHFDRRVQSVLIRYQPRPPDPYLSDPTTPAAATPTPAPPPPPPTPPSQAQKT